jgi:branched-chain amino acid transport system substrate-binding protein
MTGLSFRMGGVRMLRRRAALAAAVLLASAPAASAADPVPVGAVEILSGPNAAYGTAIKAGLDLALAAVNAEGGRQLALTVEDSGGTKDGAINAARKLIGRDKVVAIIGPTLSNEMFAMGPVTSARGIPTIGTSTTAKGITDIGPFIFRTALPEADVVPVTLKKAIARGAKTIALLYANDDAFSKSGFDSMQAAAQAVGLTILATESFGSKDTDFSAQLTKIKALKPDAVGISALVEPISGVLLQARQLGFGPETLFIGGNGANSPKLGQIAGAAADGILVGSPWFIAKPDKLNQDFIAAFRKAYGKDPDQFAAQAYDTLLILAEAVDRAGDADPKKIRDALQATDHTGPMGPFRFTDHRDPASTEGVVVLEMHGGAFRIAE